MRRLTVTLDVNPDEAFRLAEPVLSRAPIMLDSFEVSERTPPRTLIVTATREGHELGAAYRFAPAGAGTRLEATYDSRGRGPLGAIGRAIFAATGFGSDRAGSILDEWFRADQERLLRDLSAKLLSDLGSDQERLLRDLSEKLVGNNAGELGTRSIVLRSSTRGGDLKQLDGLLDSLAIPDLMPKDPGSGPKTLTVRADDPALLRAVADAAKSHADVTEVNVSGNEVRMTVAGDAKPAMEAVGLVMKDFIERSLRSGTMGAGSGLAVGTFEVKLETKSSETRPGPDAPSTPQS